MNMQSWIRRVGACVLLGGMTVDTMAQTVPEIMARVREATGAEALAHLDPGIRIEGLVNFLGNECRLEAAFDASGRSMIGFIGPVSLQTGFDGKDVWSIDLAGEPRVLQLGERESYLFGAGVMNHRWFAEGESLDFELVSDHDSADTVMLGYEHDSKRSRGTVEISRESWMPLKWTSTSGDTTTVWELEGVLELEGLKLPAKVLRTTNANLVETMILQKVSRLASDSSLARPDHTLSDWTYDPSIPAALEIKKARTGHLLVRTKLDGVHPCWFIFDTGAGANVLCISTMERYGYESVASIPAVGVGGSIMASVVHPTSLQVGPMTISSPFCPVMDLKMLTPIMGEEISGIVGYGLMARCIAEIDSAEGRVSLHDPRKYTLPRGEWMEVIDYEKHPCVRANMEGHQGIFKLDTGAANSWLTVHEPAVTRLNMLDGRETTDSQMGGVGGFVKSKLRELDWFELAGKRFDRMPTSFAIEPKGAFADEYTLGNIGGKVIGAFIMVLDYPNGRIAFMPRVENRTQESE